MLPRTIQPAAPVLASLVQYLVWSSCRFLQRDVHVAMRTFEFLSDSVWRKFNVSVAKVAGHLQIFRMAQDDGFAALRTVDLLSDKRTFEPDMNTAGRAAHFDGFRLFGLPVLSVFTNPQPNRCRATAGQ